MHKKNIDDYPLILKPKDVAEILGCSYVTATRLFREPSFPAVRITKGMSRVSREAFFSWLTHGKELEGADIK